MKGSRKKPVMDSEENNNKASLEEEEEEQGEEQEEEGASKREDNPDAEMQEEEEQQQEQEEEEEGPKLEEGFYEIEAIRKRRVRKGQLQYLIKWRGWPESAKTWEPIENLQTCSDVIDAFEERLQKSTRKRKGRFGGHYSTLLKKRRASSSEPSTDDLNPDGPDSGNGLIGEGAVVKDVEVGDEMRVETVQENESPSNGVKDDEQKKEGGVCISIQINSSLREEEGLVEDGSSKVECVQPLQGAKKRKSGCVRRFKQDALQPQGSQDGKGEKLGSEDVDSTEDDNGERQKLDEDAKPPYITKILRAVEYHASVTNNVQQVSIKFKALRSDGQEVLVDDKDLKANNPLLLISYYEQHLRYSPPVCDVNEQQAKLDLSV